MNILDEANKILNNKDDERKYGGIIDSLKKTSIIASEISNKNITSHDVALVFIASKLGRESYSHKQDNLVDAVAYIEMLNQLINNKND